jgi:hypothetical protein
MVEFVVELLAAGPRAAATLGPGLNTAAAVQTLLDGGRSQ